MRVSLGGRKGGEWRCGGGSGGGGLRVGVVAAKKQESEIKGESFVNTS